MNWENKNRDEDDNIDVDEEKDNNDNNHHKDFKNYNKTRCVGATIPTPWEIKNGVILHGHFVRYKKLCKLSLSR